MFKAIVNKHTLENFIPLLKGLVTFNARAVTLGVDKALRQMYENYLEVNPNFKEGEDALSFEEYQRLFEHNIKAMLGELVLLVGLTGSMLALSNGTDDEDKDKKGILLVMDRFYNELTYFYNIQSYLDMGGISVPLINTASDVGKFMTEVLDNVWGITTNNSELISKEDLWKKGSKITIGLRQYDNIQKLIDNYGY
jgi:lysyl-tRNA synthetase class I